ncbi:hypothetical protein NHL50_15170 [Acidimicrobiia bacterium EGI L10123]|uniref:hypothetical protein n=1 Tax=Salinilacustrithrix flava TaxID=2957203 RepID=UPI003D7C27F6|nr:hypothetical protein [Acidimicrobiia bacterium EGI L10123]
MELRRLLAAVFAVVALWALLGSGVRATYGARVTADEPQYLLSAISLVEDGDLDIADELAVERWRDFHDAQLPRQTEPRPDGSELSPHDPLLPVLLAPGVAVAQVVAGDWQHAELAGARVVLALVAGALAALLVRTAVARLGVRRSTAVVVVGAFALAAPLSTYGNQLYPELVAALAVAVGAAALLELAAAAEHRRRWGSTVAWVGAVVALPWLGVKYAAVAAAIAALGLVFDRRHRVAALVALVVAGVAYLVVHQRVYGGWTVYAAGDHFVDGELTVVGNDPDHLGRTVRLAGLLVDRHFGLLVWAPAYLLALPAVGALLRRRDRIAAVLLVPLAAGWATATWVALTMHGWWWPGRQVVVVLPLAVLAVTVFVDRERRAGARWVWPVLVGTGAVGVTTWAWLAIEATFGGLRLIVDFDRTTNPWVQAAHLVLPDLREGGWATDLVLSVWAVVLLALAAWGWRRGRSGRRGTRPASASRPGSGPPSADSSRGDTAGSPPGHR